MKKTLFLLFVILSVLSFSAVYVEYGKVVFTAPFPKDKVVYLAGQFNNWNPTAWPMTWDDEKGVWIYKFELKPGTYQYKFVIGGTTWKEDPEAPGYTDDGFGGKNGVFTLVEKDGELMIISAQVSTVQQPGKEYELNPKRENTIYFDNEGYLVLRFYAPNAKFVTIAGIFNNWDANATECYPAEDGWWEAVFEQLDVGVYEYKFVIDGKEWVTDPNAFAFVDDGFGGKNGVFRIYIEKGEYKVGAPEVTKKGEPKPEKTVQTTPAVQPTEMVTVPTTAKEIPEGVSLTADGYVVFKVKKPNAEAAYLAGSFNNWNPTALKMTKVGDYWTTQLKLSKGVYSYKYVFIISGNQVWEEDPFAPGYEPDGFGGKNGVFNVVEKDGKLTIEKPESTAGGLKISGYYEFSHKFRLDEANYLVGTGTTHSLYLNFKPNDVVDATIKFSGANVDKATLNFKLDDFTILARLNSVLPLPVEGAKTGVAISTKVAVSEIIFDLGSGNKLPILVGMNLGQFGLYGARNYFFGEDLEFLGTVSLELVGLNLALYGGSSLPFQAYVFGGEIGLNNITVGAKVTTAEMYAYATYDNISVDFSIDSSFSYRAGVSIVLGDLTVGAGYSSDNIITGGVLKNSKDFDIGLKIETNLSINGTKFEISGKAKF